MKTKISKIIFRAIGITLAVLLTTSIGFYLLQDSFIFQGKTLESGYHFKFDQDFQEYSIQTDDGATLNALRFNAHTPSNGLVLYFHGNADNLQRWGQYAVDFTSRGFDVLMVDYRGYGKSSGSPSEAILYKDALAVWNWAALNIPYSHTIIYGRSLGAAVASQLATIRTPDLLMLETPFDDLSGTLYPPFRPLLMILPIRSQFPNKEFIPKITCPIVIFHGTSDWVVPLASSLKLRPLLKPRDRFIIIEDGGHRNLRDFESYHKALDEGLEMIQHN